MSSWGITGVSPTGGPVSGDTVITLTGFNLDRLERVNLVPPSGTTPFTVHHNSAGEVRFVLPCSVTDFGEFQILVRLTGGLESVPAISHSDGLRLLCHQTPQFDDMYPFVGPSWPGTHVNLLQTRPITHRGGMYN